MGRHQLQHQQQCDVELVDVSVLAGLTKAQTMDRYFNGFSCHAACIIAAVMVYLGAFVGTTLAFSSGVDAVFAPGPLSGLAALAVTGAVALAAWSFLHGSPPCGKASSLVWLRSGGDRHQHQRQQQRQRQEPLRMRGWWGDPPLLRGMCFVLVMASASGFQPADRTALKFAVEAWCTDSSTSFYGDINTWDVRTCICTHSLEGPPQPHP